MVVRNSKHQPNPMTQDSFQIIFEWDLSSHILLEPPLSKDCLRRMSLLTRFTFRVVRKKKTKFMANMNPMGSRKRRYWGRTFVTIRSCVRMKLILRVKMMGMSQPYRE